MNTFPQYVKFSEGGTVMVHRGNGVYYRDAGAWELQAVFKTGRLLVKGKGQTSHLDGLELVPATNEEYCGDNAGYVGIQR